MLSLDQMVETALHADASDIHLVAGLCPKLRVSGRIQNLSEGRLSAADCEAYAKELAGSEYEKISTIGEIDLAKSFACGVRTRINVFRQQKAVSVAIRLLKNRIPEIEELGLPKAVEKFSGYRSGIVLVTGETGSGKSTTLAAILNRINRTRQGHIITLEDPIEYIFTPNQCIVNQRQIGVDTRSYPEGLRSILREDPDVILIGEMRDLETITAALTAAETGHLVLATLHTNSAAGSIDRIVNSFSSDQQQQVRQQLSSTLRAVLSQELLPKKGGVGRVAACEVMIVTPAIRNLIREGKSTQIDSFITMSTSEGSLSFDSALRMLVRDGKVSQETAEQYYRGDGSAHKPGM